MGKHAAWLLLHRSGGLMFDVGLASLYGIAMRPLLVCFCIHLCNVAARSDIRTVMWRILSSTGRRLLPVISFGKEVSNGVTWKQLITFLTFSYQTVTKVQLLFCFSTSHLSSVFSTFGQNERPHGDVDVFIYLYFATLHLVDRRAATTPDWLLPRLSPVHQKTQFSLARQ